MRNMKLNHITLDFLMLLMHAVRRGTTDTKRREIEGLLYIQFTYRD